MSYDDRKRWSDNADENDDAISEFLERRSRRREYEEFLEQYTPKNSADSGYIGSRESNAARRVLSEGRVSGRESGMASRQRSASGNSQGSYYRQRQSSPQRPRNSTDSARRYTNSNNTEKYKKSRSKSRQKKRKRMTTAVILRRLVLAAVLLIAAFFVSYYTLIDALTADIVRTEIVTDTVVAPSASVAHIDVRGDTSTVKNVLLLGIDDDGESGSRSDTIMIASVDTRNDTVKLCSILRDNYVSIPGRNDNRINAAYAFGGAELALQTIEANFRVDIDYYVSVNMEAMRHIVDAVGGVTITITEAEAKQINRYSWSSAPAVSAGEMQLDGKQAVSYAQIRKIDSDFGRTSRQRVLINAIAAKCKTMSLGKLASMVSTVSPYLTTNLTSAEIASLGLKVMPALNNEIEQMSIPVEETYSNKHINGMDVLVGDIEENTRLLHEFIYGE